MLHHAEGQFAYQTLYPAVTPRRKRPSGARSTTKHVGAQNFPLGSVARGHRDSPCRSVRFPNQTPQSHIAPTTAETQIKRGRPRVVCSRWIYYAVPPDRLAVPSTNSNRSDRAVLERPGESLGDLLPLRGNRIALGEHEDHLDRPQGSLDPFLLNGFQSQRFEVARPEPWPPVKYVEPLFGDCSCTPPRPQ